MTALTPEGPNRDQIEYWNEKAGPKWVAHREALDRQIGPLSLAALDRAAVHAGERALDVGCGCGASTLELARRVGPTGRVLGIDISGPMLAQAEQRAGGFPQVRFANADAQTYRFEPGAFDLAFSRFGVMFFREPELAFRNLHGALAKGGRLAFVCWREPGENPWMTEPTLALAAHIPLPPPGDPNAPGPFAFANPERVRGILERAGFGEVSLERHDADMALGKGDDPYEAADLMLQIGPAAAAAREAGITDLKPLRESVARVLEKYRTPRGILMKSATWLVHARA